MLLWLALACVTAAALAAVLRPLGAAQSQSAPDHPADIAIYRDQLAEIENERARGLLGQAEAEAARTEVARRLLASDEAIQRSGTESASAVGSDGRRVVRLGVAVAAAVPVLALALYLAIGSPGLPDQPLQTRLAAKTDNSSLAALVASVEARLRDAPNDGKGWDVIAPVYLKSGRYAEAAVAYENAARLLGPSFQRLAGFAEAATLAANGIVTPEARAAYQRLAEMAPSRHEPKFWLALAQEQDGNLAGAAAGYKAMLETAPPEAPWRAMVTERFNSVIARLPASTPAPSATTPPKASETTAPPASATAPSLSPSPPSADGSERGPTADDVAAAAKLTDAERTAMIEQMVSGLATRLKADGRDLRGWQRLIRALVVLGRIEDARSALGEARTNLRDDAAAQTELGLLAKSLGLGT